MSNQRPTGSGRTGLALSGGGFRACLFHVGSVWRLNELGLLREIDEITSVSGGSILAAWLGLKWRDLSFDECGKATNFKGLIASPLQAFCSRTIDVGSILGGIINPFVHASRLVTRKYRKFLFHDATLQDLPTEEQGPRFTIYATSMQTGRSVRFSRPYLADYRIGTFPSPTVSVAEAVAASAAFPPPLCPLKLTLDPARWEDQSGTEFFGDEYLKRNLYLTDGGVYDNLGLERLWDRCTQVLVSDGGSPFRLDRKALASRWSMVARTKRTLEIMMDQVHGLRTSRLVDDFKHGARAGTYWGIGTQIGDYELEAAGKRPAMTIDSENTSSLCRMRTRLNAFSSAEQGHLINWGYALTDAAIRRHVLNTDPGAGTWPFPEYPL